jgi:hypothetical protein
LPTERIGLLLEGAELIIVLSQTSGVSIVSFDEAVVLLGEPSAFWAGAPTQP